MYVERLSWVVPPELVESSLNLFAVLHHHMDASGGLIRALAGRDAKTEGHLISMTFWRDWENLSRFLASSKAALVAESADGSSLDRPKPQHFEVVWEWPQEEVDTKSGEWHWALHDFMVEPARVEDLLVQARRFAPTLSHGDGFVTAGLWIDRNNPNHVVFASQWSSKAIPDIEVQSQSVNATQKDKIPFSEQKIALYRVRATDPLHLGVP